MGYYFDDFQSIAVRNSLDVRSTLRTIAGRYIGENPPSKPVFRATSERGILRAADYRYRFNLAERFPGAPEFAAVYAWGALYEESQRTVPLAVSIDAPLKVYLNGELIFKSHIGHERTGRQKHPFEAKLKAGWNNFVLEFVKTARGFGGVFGTGNKKSFAFHFLTPSSDRLGAEGWLFTAPSLAPLAKLPLYGDSEASTGRAWLPEAAWEPREAGQGVYLRLFGLRPGQRARSWTSGDFRQQAAGEYRCRGKHDGPFSLWIGGTETYRADRQGEFDITAEVPYGRHDIVTESVCGQDAWGFDLDIQGADGQVAFRLPIMVEGVSQTWLHGGPFEAGSGSAAEFVELAKPLKTVDGLSYYRLDAPGVLIRPFMESGNFGHWHYPIGVTLYGLLATGRVLESADIEVYAQQHLQTSADWYEYAVWDGAKYGAASLLHHLFQMDCLDDCGSNGAALLEAALRVGLDHFNPLVDDIAAYIETKQERLADGAFYRNKADNPFMAGIVWSDDLYMSVPFLIRYWKVTSNETYLDDAVLQFRLYKKYLFIKELRVMSHIYDADAGLANRRPWGRGNGWVLFSLTELLTVLPESHAARGELLDFYRELCDGYLALQDGNGMWHQLLSDPGSYPEASCTSMFLYSFARGLRLGWLHLGFGAAARKAWGALCSNAVDYKGNVYGICRGSGFSFTESYYRDELNWVLNDLHGIGIILLAGAEFLDWELRQNQKLRGGDR
jgi:rhamnogalacturonyl hydrolase YesR